MLFKVANKKKGRRAKKVMCVKDRTYTNIFCQLSLNHSWSNAPTTEKKEKMKKKKQKKRRN
jgi:hypothetical protein